MKLIWQTYGKTEAPYTNDNLRAALAQLTGDQPFADAFFATYIDQGNLPDYAPLLARAGLELGPAGDGAWIGDTGYDGNGGRVSISTNTLRGTPLYKAGLDRGDEIVRLGRFEISRAGDIAKALGRHMPGDYLEIEYIQRGIKRTSQIELEESPDLKITMMDNPSAAQTAFRESWLGVDE